MAAAKQDIFEVDFALVRSRRVSGLFVRHTWPPALMVSANQVPNRSADK